jgi:AraC-like DNA-binding protein
MPVVLPASPAGPVEPQTFRERRPSAAAASHLSSVWVQSVAPGAAPYRHRTVPHGSVELAVALGETPRVVGPRTGPEIATLAPGTTVVGVRFRPGAAPSVLGVPASELVDLEAGAEELLGRSAVAIGDAAAAAASPDAAAALLERAIVESVAGAPAPDPIVAGAVRGLLPSGASEVGSLTSSLFISDRQLRRRMTAAIGLAPKAVQRILRFQGFLALAHARGPADTPLALLAADAGYADQAHLTRESLRLAGVSPRVLLREALESCVGIHDHRTSWASLLRNRMR